jgi:hypothetical protein
MSRWKEQSYVSYILWEDSVKLVQFNMQMGVHVINFFHFWMVTELLGKGGIIICTSLYITTHAALQSVRMS